MRASPLLDKNQGKVRAKRLRRSNNQLKTLDLTALSASCVDRPSHRGWWIGSNSCLALWVRWRHNRSVNVIPCLYYVLKAPIDARRRCGAVTHRLAFLLDCYGRCCVVDEGNAVAVLSGPGRPVAAGRAVSVLRVDIGVERSFRAVAWRTSHRPLRTLRPVSW